MSKVSTSKSLSGIIPIVAAVFDDQGNVDLCQFERLIEHLMGTNASGLTLFGLATEFYKLTDHERNEMMSILLSYTSTSDSTSGIISITHHSWEAAVVQAVEAEKGGADALMLLPPYFLMPSLDAIMEHIRRVVTAVSVPVIIQYAPNQTMVRIPPEAFIELNTTCPNLSYVKVETQPPGKYASLIHELSGNRLHTLIGYAGVQMPDVLDRGSAGIQPGCSFTEVYTALYDLHQSGRREEFDHLFGRLLPYITYWMQGVELIIAAEKEILRRRGIIASSYCRSPFYSLDRSEQDMIDRFLQEFAAYL